MAEKAQVPVAFARTLANDKEVFEWGMVSALTVYHMERKTEARKIQGLVNRFVATHLDELFKKYREARKGHYMNILMEALESEKAQDD